MRIEQLEYLIAIYKYHSMSLAAEHIHVSQQAISSATRQLEDEFGFKLVLTSKNGSSLTPAGIQLMNLANKFFQDCEALRNNSSSAPLQELTILTLANSDMMLWSTIADFFYNNYPDLTLKRKIIPVEDSEAFMTQNETCFFLDVVSDSILNSWSSKIKYKIFSKNYLHLIVSSNSDIVKKELSLKSLKNYKILMHCQRNQNSIILDELNKYPSFISNNNFVYDIPSNTFFKLISQNQDTIGVIPFSQEMTSFFSLPDNVKVIKLKESIPIYSCCATVQNSFPFEILDFINNHMPPASLEYITN